MEVESEWRPIEEEEEAAAVEELDSSLETRQRKKGKMGTEDEERVANGEDYSVYLDEDEGQANNVTVGLELREEQFIGKKNTRNGSSEFGAQGSNGHEKIPIAEEIQDPKNLVTENGSISHMSSAIKSQDEPIKMENEIEECEQYKPEKGNELLIPEFVERVVEEQETHDFFCPNCNSCITKRVILKRRKRKRVPAESQPDLPPEKIPHVQEPTHAPTEREDDERETGFRCLECFSFFIPTEGGFISWIFGRRGESKNLQSSEKVPSNGVSSCLSASDSSKKKGTGAGFPLLGEASGGPSPGLERRPLPISENASFSENGTSTGINNADLSAGQSYFKGGVIGSQAQESKQSYSTTVSENKQSYPALTVLKDLSAGASVSDSGVVGDQHQGNKQSYPGTTASEDPSAGASISDGGVVGDQHQGNKQSYPGTTASEANGTEKPGPVFKPPSIEEISQTSQIVTKPPAAPFVSQANGTEKPGPVFKPPSIEEISQTSQTVTKPPAAPFVSQGNINKPGSTANPTPPIDQNIHASGPIPTVETRIDVGQRVVEPVSDNRWDVLKSIVFGGLIESIASLCIVSSAAGSGTSTLNICALGLANLIGGLFVISHDLSELRRRDDSEASDQTYQQLGRYWDLLGKREHFRLHAVVAILSYIIFGSLPPIIYGFTFRVSDNKEYKLIAVAAASLLFTALLAVAKAHVRQPRDYFKSLLYYLAIAVPASGLSYVAGVMLDRLFEELGLFDQSSVSPSPPSSIGLSTYSSGASGWASI